MYICMPWNNHSGVLGLSSRMVFFGSSISDLGVEYCPATHQPLPKFHQNAVYSTSRSNSRGSELAAKVLGTPPSSAAQHV